jgi:uncharacterized OB-fold protein
MSDGASVEPASVEPRGLAWPALEPTSQGYWRAAREGRLVIQRCDDCGTHRHPPTEACYACQSLNWSWDEVPGTGRVFTYTWVDRPVAPQLAHLGVYNITVVELDGTQGEPVRVLTRIDDVARDDLAIGLEVEVGFETLDDESALPVFRPRTLP